MIFQKRVKTALLPIIAGTNSLGYPQRRNFASLPFLKYKFKKYYDLNNVLNGLYYKTYHRSHHYFANAFNDFNLNPAPFYHFFNTISFGKKPWITTFETDIPRWGAVAPVKYENGIRMIAGSKCKAIIAISECTAMHQLRCMEEYYPAHKDAVISKMEIIHPSQSLCIKEYGEKKLERDHLNFTIVGNDFFRKGGKEILQVFDRLLEKKSPLKLHIISRFEYGDYASKSTIDDLNEALKIISKYPENIFQYSQIENSKVMELLKRSHIGLLPTWADTYGYSVLEAQASGCPVITTDVRALPEINDDETGWIIPVPKDSFGTSIITTPFERKKFSERLAEQLYTIVNEIIDHPGQIVTKGKKSLDRISTFHSPEDCAGRLEKIYDSIH